MSDPSLVSSNECDIEMLLIALKYDTCDATEKCEPCKGLRLKSIAAIERLELGREQLSAMLVQQRNTIAKLQAQPSHEPLLAPSDRLPDGTIVHVCTDDIPRIGKRADCSVCSGSGEEVR